MSDPYAGVLKKYGLYIGLALVVLAAWAVNYVYSYHRLNMIKPDAMRHFKSVSEFRGDTLPKTLNVAGPDGNIVNLADTDGKFTILNIWATWCAPCVKELPYLRQLNKQLQPTGDWRVIAVSIDSPQNIPKVATFTQKHNVEEIAAYHDYARNVQNFLPITVVPATYIIDDNGELLYKIQGDAIWFDKDIVDFLTLLAVVH